MFFVSTLSVPASTSVYSSNSGRCPGSSQPLGERMRAILTRLSPLLTRPTNSSISLGGVPAAVTRVGLEISWAMGHPLLTLQAIAGLEGPEHQRQANRQECECHAQADADPDVR